MPETMPIKPWKVIESSRPRKNLRVDKCELPNGSIIETMILEYGTWATIVGITKQQEVILIQQYRHGAGRVIWEFPGGVVDQDESPLQAAKRELLEESGYSSATWIETGMVSANPDTHTNLIHTFLALDIEKVAAQNLDDTEEIDVFPTPLDEVIQMAIKGELLQSMQVSALFFALAELRRIK
ncbi:MAG: NUDIX hydrolase [Chloroflexi bacterium]|nr:NUDIX hydrolase [Chloroflexota bacterium]